MVLCPGHEVPEVGETFSCPLLLVGHRKVIVKVQRPVITFIPEDRQKLGKILYARLAVRRRKGLDSPRIVARNLDVSRIRPWGEDVGARFPRVLIVGIVVIGTGRKPRRLHGIKQIGNVCWISGSSAVILDEDLHLDRGEFCVGIRAPFQCVTLVLWCPTPPVKKDPVYGERAAFYQHLDQRLEVVRVDANGSGVDGPRDKEPLLQCLDARPSFTGFSAADRALVYCNAMDPCLMPGECSSQLIEVAGRLRPKKLRHEFNRMYAVDLHCDLWKIEKRHRVMLEDRTMKRLSGDTYVQLHSHPFRIRSLPYDCRHWLRSRPNIHAVFGS